MQSFASTRKHTARLFMVLKAMAALSIVFLVAACATTVNVAARFPARNMSAAELRRIAVSDFDGPTGDEFANALEATLASAEFDNARYFILVDSGQRGNSTEARSAAMYGRSVGAQGVFFGHVENAAAHDESFQGTAVACVVNEPNGKCKKWGLVQVPCVRRVVELSVIPSLVDVSTAQVVYSERKAATSDTSWCQGQDQSVSDDALLAAARNKILADMRLDVAPHNAVLQATLKEDSDGLPKGVSDRFDAAVADAKKGDMAEACRAWGEVNQMSPNNPGTVYDLGVCAEADGNYYSAMSLYQKARSLTPQADGDIEASIARTQQLLGAANTLAAEKKAREDQAAAQQRAAAEQAKEQREREHAAKAARDAKHAKLVAAFGAKDAALIEAGKIRIGMSEKAVIAARGAPSRREKVPPDSELWHYGSDEVGFTKGKVTHISS